MAKTRSSYSPSNCFFPESKIIVPRYVQCQILHCWVYPVADIPRRTKIRPLWPKQSPHTEYSPSMAKTWSPHGPSNWFFLYPNHCAQGYSFPNSKLLVLSCSPFPRNSQNMALYVKNMVLRGSLKLVLLPES